MTLELDQLLPCFAEGKQEMGGSFDRAFGIQCDFDELTSLEMTSEVRDSELKQPGLLLCVGNESVNVLFILGTSSGLIPDWFSSENPTHRNMLNTLAQEVGFTQLPEAMAPTEFDSIAVAELDKALSEGGVPEDAPWFSYSAKIGDTPAKMLLVGGCVTPDSIERMPPPEPAQASDSIPEANATSDSSPPSSHPPSRSSSQKITKREELPGELDAAIPYLPNYTKSLLNISVPVRVKLASTRQSVNSIVGLSLGSIIQFDKSCEEPLQMEVSGHPVAFGDAVKVGDKFGLRITSIAMPPERFTKIQREN